MILTLGTQLVAVVVLYVHNVDPISMRVTSADRWHTSVRSCRCIGDDDVDAMARRHMDSGAVTHCRIS